MAKASHPTEKPKPASSSKPAALKHQPRISNRRALHDYHVLERLEVGIALLGSEVKSVRKGRVQLAQAFARIRNGSVMLYGCHIEEYVEANRFNHDPTRTRQLLLHRREIRRLEQALKKQPGTTLIPLEMFFSRGFAKVLLALAIGKQVADKRAAIKEREERRDAERTIRQRR